MVLHVPITTVTELISRQLSTLFLERCVRACGFGAMLLVLLAISGGVALADKTEEAAQALRAGNDAVAIEAISGLLVDTSLGNEKRAVLHTDRGAARMRLQQFRAALEDFNRAAQLYPENPAIYINRGNLLLVLSQPQEAVRDFDRALLLAPKLAAVFTNRAAAYLRLGRNDLALADYSRAVELSPRDPVVLSGRGRAHLVAGRPHASIRDFTRAAELNSSFGQAYRNRAEARMRVGQFDEAASDLSRTLAFDPSRVDDYVARGEAYLAAGNSAAAVKDFDKVIAGRPQSVAGYVGRSRAYAEIGTYDAALDDLTRALEIDPKSGVSYAARAFVYTRMQQPSLAERDLERLQKLEPGAADTLWVQGEIEEAYGRRDAAVAAYRKALGIDGRHRDALASLARIGVGDGRGEQVIAGPAVDGWRIVAIGQEYWALNESYPKLRVLLEMSGPGEPKVLQWERRKPPFSGFGVMRYAAGTVLSGNGQVGQENFAVLDLTNSAVVSVVVAKVGDAVAKLDWDDGQLTVAGADGLKEQFRLTTKTREDRDAAAAVTAAATAASTTPRRSRSQDDDDERPVKKSGGTPAWAPWAQNTPAASSVSRRDTRPKPKPKSIFDMLFGN